VARINPKLGILQHAREFRISTPRSKHVTRARYQAADGYNSQNNHSFQRPSRRDFGNPNIVVGSVIAACGGVFAWKAYNVEEAKKGSRKARKALADFEKHMVMSLQNIREGRYYTILTSTFAHSSVSHLLFNMMALWSFGPPIVGIYGVPTFAMLWVGAGLTGGVAQLYFWSKNSPYDGYRGVGASGSILGILGALTCLMPHSRVTLIVFPMSLLNSTLLTIGLSVAAIQQGWLPSLGHADHLGGLVFGAFWYLIAMRRGKLGARRY